MTVEHLPGLPADWVGIHDDGQVAVPAHPGTRDTTKEMVLNERTGLMEYPFKVDEHGVAVDPPKAAIAERNAWPKGCYAIVKPHLDTGEFEFLQALRMAEDAGEPLVSIKWGGMLLPAMLVQGFRGTWQYWTDPATCETDEETGLPDFSTGKNFRLTPIPFESLEEEPKITALTQRLAVMRRLKLAIVLSIAQEIDGMSLDPLPGTVPVSTVPTSATSDSSEATSSSDRPANGRGKAGSGKTPTKPNAKS